MLKGNLIITTRLTSQIVLEMRNILNILRKRNVGCAKHSNLKKKKKFQSNVLCRIFKVSVYVPNANIENDFLPTTLITFFINE